MSSTIDDFFADADETEDEGWAYITDENGLQKFTITDAAKYEAHCAKRDAIRAERVAQDDAFRNSFDIDCG